MAAPEPPSAAAAAAAAAPPSAAPAPAAAAPSLPANADAAADPASPAEPLAIPLAPAPALPLAFPPTDPAAASPAPALPPRRSWHLAVPALRPRPPHRAMSRAEIVAQLMARGVDAATAGVAVDCTGAASLDAAMAFLLEQEMALQHPTDKDQDPALAALHQFAAAMTTPAPPPPRPLKSILKQPARDDPNATDAQGRRLSNASVSSASGTLLSSALGQRTSQWLKRTLNLDVDVAAASLGTSLRALLPTSPTDPAHPSGTSAHGGSSGAPHGWLSLTADPDARIPAFHSPLYEDVDARPRTPSDRALAIHRRRSTGSMPPYATIAEEPELEAMAANAPASPTTTDSSSALGTAMSAPSLVGGSKRVRFALPRLPRAPPAAGSSGASTTGSDVASSVSADDAAMLDHPPSPELAPQAGEYLPAALHAMEVVAPELPSSKPMYTVKEVIQAYLAACTDRRTRPLKAVMDGLVPHVSKDSAPTALVLENARVRRADILCLGALLELEYGLLDVRLINIGLTNDLARYLLACLFKVDSCPSLSLAENPDLVTPVPIQGVPPTHNHQQQQQQHQAPTRTGSTSSARPRPASWSLGGGNHANNEDQQPDGHVPMPFLARRRSSSFSNFSLSAITNSLGRALTASSDSMSESSGSSTDPPARSSTDTPTNGAAASATAPPSPPPTPAPPAIPMLPSFAHTIGAYVRKSSALRSLDLTGIPLGTGGMDLTPLADALTYGPDGRGSTVQVLTLDRCKLTTEALQVLCPGIAQSNVSSLSLRGNAIDPMGAAVLAGLFVPETAPPASPRYDPLWRDVVMGKRPRGLVVLDVSDNSIGRGIRALGIALATSHHVKHLLLSNNGINGGALAMFCQAVRSNRSVELIDLSCNMFGHDGKDVDAMAALAEWLGQRTEEPEEKDAATAAATPSARPVSVIDVAGAAPSETGGSTAIWRDFKEIDLHDASPLVAASRRKPVEACPLKCLSVAKSDLSTAAIIALSNGLVRNTNLERLNVAMNTLELGAYMALAQALLAHPRITRVELGPMPSDLEPAKRAFVRDLERTTQRNMDRAKRELQLAAMRDALDRAWAAARAMAVALGVAPPAADLVAQGHDKDDQAFHVGGSTAATPAASGDAANYDADDDEDDEEASDEAPKMQSAAAAAAAEDRIHALRDKCLEYRTTLNEYIMGQDECDPRFMDQVLLWNDTFTELLAKSS
ncbi:hypothetical protein GGF31_000529 [Allomyces arbusculus]|nr:hypothetical protein GGF31_000529 [Allomyces arbusculus]